MLRRIAIGSVCRFLQIIRKTGDRRSRHFLFPALQEFQICPRRRNIGDACFHLIKTDGTSCRLVEPAQFFVQRDHEAILCIIPNRIFLRDKKSQDRSAVYSRQSFLQRHIVFICPEKRDLPGNPFPCHYLSFFGIAGDRHRILCRMLLIPCSIRTNVPCFFCFFFLSFCFLSFCFFQCDTEPAHSNSTLFFLSGILNKHPALLFFRCRIDRHLQYKGSCKQHGNPDI